MSYAAKEVPVLDGEQQTKFVETLGNRLMTNKDKIVDFLTLAGVAEPDVEFVRMMDQSRGDLQYLLQLSSQFETAEQMLQAFMWIAGQPVLRFNEGGMGTGVSGPKLAENILMAGGLARLSSIGCGRYHPDVDRMQNNQEGVNEIYNRLELVFSQIKHNINAPESVDLYTLLDLQHPSAGRTKPKLPAPHYLNLLDTLTAAEQILALSKIPEMTGRGMLGINVMEKTQANERMIKLAALAFSKKSSEHGERSRGLVSLSAGVSENTVEMLLQLKDQIPELQIPRLDIVVSMGAPAETFFKAWKKSADERGISPIYPDLVTIENPWGGGHLGAGGGLIKSFEVELNPDDPKHNQLSKMRTSANTRTPDAVYSTLKVLQKYGADDCALSLGGAAHLNTKEQMRHLALVKQYSRQVRREVRLENPHAKFTMPQVGWQLGTPFAAAADGDSPASSKMDRLAATYHGNKYNKNDFQARKLAEHCERNRTQFVDVIKNAITSFQNTITAWKNDAATLAERADDIKALEKRIEAGKHALAQIAEGRSTIVFESTVKFEARGVPNVALGRIIMGLELREQDCVTCLKICGYIGIDVVKGKQVKKPFGFVEFELDGQEWKVAREGFCIEEELRTPSGLVFRGNGDLQPEISSSVSHLARNTRKLVGALGQQRHGAWQQKNGR